jgi:hypothetical protein
MSVECPKQQDFLQTFHAMYYYGNFVSGVSFHLINYLVGPHRE